MIQLKSVKNVSTIVLLVILHYAIYVILAIFWIQHHNVNHAQKYAQPVIQLLIVQAVYLDTT